MTCVIAQTQKLEMQQEQLRYVQSMLGELRTMAKSNRQELIAYLVEMAYLASGDALRDLHQERQGQANEGEGTGEAAATAA